jgi:uncharacterized protein
VSHVLLAIPIGLGTGLLLGMLGAGGSVLTVPALVYLLGQPVAAATTASLVIVSGNAAVGAADNARHGTLDRGLALRFGVASIAGALLGSYLSRLVGGTTILFLLALVMLGSAWSLWRGRPTERECETRRALPLVAALGLAVGILTGFFGVGGGFLIVPALVLLLGASVRIAIGTSLVIITVSALTGLGGHLATGGVSWPITLAFGGAGIVGVLAGTRAGRHVDGDSLSRAFAAMLVAVACFLLVKNGMALAG